MRTCNQCRNMVDCSFDAAMNDANFNPNESADICAGFEPITNADRIRAMSDEELKYIARAILKAEDCPAGDIECTKCVFHSLCLRSEYYYGNEGEWLKQPVED